MLLGSPALYQREKKRRKRRRQQFSKLMPQLARKKRERLRLK
jgi:hypothetical protein